MLSRFNLKVPKRLFTLILTGLLLLFFSGCFMLNRYIYTDKELHDRYTTKALKPVYHNIPFLKHRLHYAVISRSDTLPLLVLVHGAPGAWYGYMNLMDDSTLQQKFKMVAPDRPGYGKSGYGYEELSTQMQALAIKEIIDHENTLGKKVVLLGRSYGAPIVAWYAIHYPQMVQKLFLVSAVIDPQKEKFYWFSPIGKWKPVQWFLPKLLNVATREKYAHPAEMLEMLPEWKHLYSPTFVISGENDRIADTANFAFAKKHLINADATFLMLKNTGHLVTYQRADLIKELLLKP